MIPPLFLLLQMPSAPPAPERVAIVVGNNTAEGRGRLRYAERDAEQMSEVLKQLGAVSQVHLLLDQRAEDLRAKFAQIRAGLGERTTLFFFYSGHADERALLMQGTRMGFEELRGALSALPSGLFVAFIDACQAGSIARLKGGTAVPIVDVDVLENDKRYRGGIFITAGAPGENAQESDELEASFFTHYLLSGLRGAADTSGDRRISLDEAYRFAYRHTLTRTRGTMLGPQHPTRHLNVEGQGQLVLTWLSERSSYLVIPEQRSGTYFLRETDSETLIAEVNKPAEQRVRIALEPGDYEIAKAENGLFLSQVVSIRPAQSVLLDESQMSARPLAEMQRKGGPAASVASLAVSYRLSTGYLFDAAPQHGAAASYLFSLGRLSLGPVLSVASSRYQRTDEIDVSLLTVEAGLRLRATLYTFWRVGLFAGLELLAAWNQQQGTLAGAREKITAYSFPERAIVGAHIELVSPFALVLYGHAGAIVYDTPSGPTARFSAGAGAGLELRL